ncbi:serine hydrolase domain-containing protein [Salinimicrobium soli]
MKNFYFLFILLLLGGSALSQDKTFEPKVQEQINESLKKDISHTYTVELDSARFVYGRVNQMTVDVVVTILDPAKKKLQEFDGPARGNEIFLFETEKAGKYQIVLSPFEKEEGNYSFKLEAVEPIAKTPEGKADQLMLPYSGDDTPGGVVLVMKDGKIIFEKGYGMANLTYDVPFTPSTVTNIGSTSKQFTAMAIKLLEERGKLSLNDDIRKYFPDLPDFGKTVTIRNLLTHTSGYREVFNTIAMTGRDLSGNLEREKIFNVVKNQPELQNDPGAEWNYNNTGYSLLAALVEKVTDTPFPEWMQNNIFKPLRMDHTMVRANPGQVVPNRSMGYSPTKEAGFEEVTDLGGAMGAGGIYTTVEDLAKWVKNYSDPKVGNKEIVKDMITPFVLTNGDTTKYGLGLQINELGGLKNINHGGADVAHRSMFMYFPEIEGAVIVESNNAAFDLGIAKKLAQSFFKDSMKEEDDPKKNSDVSEDDFQFDPEKFDVFTGKYELEEAPGFILTFKRDGERIYTQATGQPEIDLQAISDTVFKVVGISAKVSFHLKDDKEAQSLTLHQNGDHLAKRINWSPGQEELKEFTGRYFSNEIETLFTVALNDSTLVLKNYQLKDLEMTPAAEDSFGVEFPIVEMEFQRNESGEITGFRASNGRARGILFRKED